MAKSTPKVPPQETDLQSSSGGNGPQDCYPLSSQGASSPGPVRNVEARRMRLRQSRPQTPPGSVVLLSSPDTVEIIRPGLLHNITTSSSSSCSEETVIVTPLKAEPKDGKQRAVLKRGLDCVLEEEQPPAKVLKEDTASIPSQDEPSPCPSFSKSSSKDLNQTATPRKRVASNGDHDSLDEDSDATPAKKKCCFCCCCSCNCSRCCPPRRPQESPRKRKESSSDDSGSSVYFTAPEGESPKKRPFIEAEATAETPSPPLTMATPPSPSLTTTATPSPPLTLTAPPSPPLTTTATPSPPLTLTAPPSPPLTTTATPSPPLTPTATPSSPLKSPSGGSGSTPELEETTSPRCDEEEDSLPDQADEGGSRSRTDSEESEESEESRSDEADDLDDVFHVTGLKNLRNTCYFNVVVQSLAQTTSLRLFLPDVEQFGPLTQAMCGLFDEIERSQGQVVVAPQGLLNEVRSKFKQFRGSRQEDSHELLVSLLAGMREELCGINGIACEGNLIDEVFGMLVTATTKCGACSAETTRTELQRDLQLPIKWFNPLSQSSISKTLAERTPPGKSERCSIQQCLYRYTSDEDLGDYKCDACSRRECCSKQSLISKAPQVLVVQLMRFTDPTTKLRRHVDFPLALDLAPYCAADCEGVPAGDTKVLYNLYAVVEHRGPSMTKGHYVAHVSERPPWRTPSEGRWLLANDSHISQSSEREVQDAKAFLLFYEKS